MEIKSVTLHACQLIVSHNTNPAALPINFYRKLIDQDFVENWKPELEDMEFRYNVTHVNIKDFKEELWNDIPVFHGSVATAGKDNSNQINKEGQYTEQDIEKIDTSPFVIFPSLSLVVIAGKDVSTHLSRYLFLKLQEDHQNDNEFANITDIKVEAATSDREPIRFLQGNLNVGGLKAKFNLNTFIDNFNPKHNNQLIAQRLTDAEKDDITVHIEFVAKRSMSLHPRFTEETLSIFDEIYQADDLKLAHYCITEEGRKSKYFRLINMNQEELVTVTYSTIVEYVEAVINEIRQYVNGLEDN